MKKLENAKTCAKGGKVLVVTKILLFTGLTSFLTGLLILAKVDKFNNPGNSDNKALAPISNMPKGPENYAAGEVIVKFKPEVKSQLKKGESPQKMGLASVEEINKQNKAQKAERVFKEEAKDVSPEEKEKLPKGVRTPDLSTVYKISFSKSVDIQKVITEYKGDPNVEYAEPNYKMEIFKTPNDPYMSSSGTWGQSYDDLWGLKKISVESAWDINTGSSDVVVAVIDTGVDYNHQDLSDNIWTNSDEIAENEIDDDGNGYIDDIHGYDFYNSDADPIDDHGHGSHCSGTIAAVTDNDKGVAGTSWNSKIMGVKFLSSGGSGYLSDAVNSIKYAADNGADVLSNSWGGWGYSQTLQDAINYAYSKGTVFVAAAGNSNYDTSYYQPAGMENVITVAATDYTDSRAWFSNYGDEVDVAAPGVDILSLKASGTSMGSTVGGHYTRASGTSMACPHVSGTTALIWSENPNYTNQEVEQMLESTADDLGDIGFDNYFGYGRINAYGALLGEPLPVSAAYSEVAVNPSSTYLGQYSTVTVTLRNVYNTPVSGKEVSISSSRSVDTIIPLQTHTDSEGKFLANITSGQAGTSTISARDVTDGININQTATINFSLAPDTTAPGNISNLKLEPSDGKILLTWANPSDSDFTGMRIMRKEEGASQSVTDGTEAYNGMETSYLNTNLTNGITYYYTVFTYDEVPNYSSGISGSAVPNLETTEEEEEEKDVVSPGEITDFKLVAGDKQIVLSWLNPSDSDFAGVKILRKEEENPKSTEDGTEVYSEKGTTHIDSNLSNGVTYYYSAFTYDQSGNYSKGSFGAAQPEGGDTTPPSSVTNFKITPQDGKVLITWTNPLDPDFAGVKILRKEDNYPQHAQDGTEIYSGIGTSYIDSSLKNGITYYYAAFTYDGSLNYSSAAEEIQARAIPNGIHIITGAGPGGGPQVRGFDKNGKFTNLSFFAFNRNFKGGVRMVAGDIDADGQDEIIVGAGTGGGPQIRVFESNGEVKPIQFFAFHPDSRTGVDVAAGDVDSDGKDEIAVSQLANGEAWIKVYRYNNEQTVIGQWRAFPAGVESGATVAMGDVDSDGIAEIIVGAGTGGGPQIRVFESNGEVKPIQFFAFHPDSRTGIDVAAGDVDADGKDEIAVSQLANGEAWIKVYRYNNDKTVLSEFRAYPQGVKSGANIDLVDVDNDGRAEVLTGAGNTGGPQIRAFKMGQSLDSVNFFAYSPYFRGGVSVIGGRW